MHSAAGADVLHEAGSFRGQPPADGPEVWVPAGENNGRPACRRALPRPRASRAAPLLRLLPPPVQVFQVGPWRRNWQGGGR